MYKAIIDKESNMITDYENKAFNPELLQKAKTRGRKSALSKEDKVKAQELRNKGYTLESIAKAFNTSHTTIARWTK